MPSIFPAIEAGSIGELAGNFFQSLQPGGVNAVVVRAEDTHFQEFRSIRVRPPM